MVDNDDLRRFEEYMRQSVEEWKKTRKPDIAIAFGEMFRLRDKKNDSHISS
jgi:hypothetical protein